MKVIKRKLSVLSAIGFLVLGAVFLMYPAEAAAAMQPTASDNLSVSLRSKSELVATANGYMRVYYDGTKIGIEYYDNNFAIQKKQSLNMELDIWGGFYAGSDGYYLVEGRNNTAESDTAEVIRVIKYNTRWEKQGTAKITGNPKLFGGEVRYPFDYGCVEMTECGGTLYIVTGHEGYVDPGYNQGHQGFLMIAVDKASMTGSIVDCDLWHSFAQYIACKNSELYVLEQSEGSRYTKLSKYNTGDLESTSLPVLEYGGSRTSAWAVSCYASVDGIALSNDHVLCLGTSIDQTKYDSVSSDTPHNIYLTVTPMSNFSQEATTVKWLTNYTGGGKCFLGTKITKINDNRFLLSWEEAETAQTADEDDTLSENVLHYIFIDGKGNAISKEFTAKAPISDCQPIVKGTDVVYYASNANMVNFYSIHTQTGDFRKKVYRVTGADTSWDLKDGVLTISGTGAMSVDIEGHRRYPLSSTSNSFSYFSSDNDWKPIRDKVEKIVVGGGVTDISEKAFAYFGSLTEVKIESGVKSIGKQAFYNCRSLNKITIPASVTSIGEDILWTGSYWVGDESHVVRATIYAPKGSYALAYAQKNGIKSVESDGEEENGASETNLSKARVTLKTTSYIYNSKVKKPAVTVKLNGKTLKQNTDYTVAYQNNVNPGTAKVTVKGRGNYTGSKTVKFTIKPSITCKKTIYKIVYGTKPFKINASSKNKDELNFTSSNSKIASVNKVSGKVTIKKTGIVTITVKSAKHAKDSAKVTIKIRPKKQTIKSTQAEKNKKLIVRWSKDKNASNYQVQVSTNKNFQKGVITKKTTKTSYTFTKLKEGKKYYVRLRSCKKSGKETLYGAWSKTKRSGKMKK